MMILRHSPVVDNLQVRLDFTGGNQGCNFHKHFEGAGPHLSRMGPWAQT